MVIFICKRVMEYSLLLAICCLLIWLATTDLIINWVSYNNIHTMDSLNKVLTAATHDLFKDMPLLPKEKEK